MLPADYLRTQMLRPMESPECCSEPSRWTIPRTAREFACCACAGRAWDTAWKGRNACAECRTKPCRRGGDCWAQVDDGFGYETYVACRYTPPRLAVSALTRWSGYAAMMRMEAQR